ncbi:hypothetical protein R3P38DRAFT_3200539 [Favolaschia claudopus]|uniref:Uncharacterized protein n=1 Tax=Favolaschia claudopus TaxID=2862362 RepID=A0AAW0AWY3_9AGAR
MNRLGAYAAILRHFPLVNASQPASSSICLQRQWLSFGSAFYTPPAISRWTPRRPPATSTPLFFVAPGADVVRLRPWMTVFSIDSSPDQDDSETRSAFHVPASFIPGASFRSIPSPQVPPPPLFPPASITLACRIPSTSSSPSLNLDVDISTYQHIKWLPHPTASASGVWHHDPPSSPRHLLPLLLLLLPYATRLERTRRESRSGTNLAMKKARDDVSTSSHPPVVFSTISIRRVVPANTSSPASTILYPPPYPPVRASSAQSPSASPSPCLAFVSLLVCRRQSYPNPPPCHRSAFPSAALPRRSGVSRLRSPPSAASSILNPSFSPAKPSLPVLYSTSFS